MAPTTLRDVALLAGVSISTASRAISGNTDRPVARETEDRIWGAVRALNYAPRHGQVDPERVDQRRQTRKVGVILRGASYKYSDPFWAPVLDGLDQELARHDYHLAYTLSLAEVRESSRRRLVSRERLDGLVLLGPMAPIPELMDLQHTVVVEGLDVMRWSEHLDVDIVTLEKRRAIYAVVAHLAVLGRRRIGFLGPGPESDERAEAFPHALVRVGAMYHPDLVAESLWTIDGGYQAALALLGTPARPDALVCASDAIATGAMQAARELGLRLPADLAITGFDDVPFAASLDPPLTTVRAPKETLGAVAGHRVVSRIQQPSLPPVILTVATSLVVRSSCGARQVVGGVPGHPPVPSASSDA